MANTQIEAMRLALEALETTWYHVGTFAPTDDAIELYDQARTSLRQAIREHAMYEVQRLGQEIEQEPVATVTSETGADITMSWWHEPALPIGTKLYTHPPQRTWQGLTDEEIRERWFAAEPTSDGRPASYNYAKAIEAKLKQKNGFAEEKNT